MRVNLSKRRRTIRLRDFDYSQTGAYFVTICTRERKCLFGEVIDSETRLNDAGKTVERCWLAIPKHFPDVNLDAFVIMPNHVHGIVLITSTPVGAKNFSPLHNRAVPPRSPSKTVGSIVRGFKIGVTKWFLEKGDTSKVWQRNYFEHVIRNKESLKRIRKYIIENPLRWAFDRENPAATTLEPKEVWLA